MLTVGGTAASVLGTGGMLMKGSYKFELDESFYLLNLGDRLL